MNEHLKAQAKGDVPSVTDGPIEIYLTDRGRVVIEKGHVTSACVWLGSNDPKVGKVEVKLIGREFRVWKPDSPNIDYFSRKYPYEHGNNSLASETLMSALCGDQNNSYAIIAVKRHLAKSIVKTFHKLDFSFLWYHWRKPIITKRTPIITQRRNTQ